MVLSCCHLHLNLSKPIHFTFKNKINQRDYHPIRLLPVFKQDIKNEPTEDPVTKQLISADDVNLFLVSIDTQKIRRSEWTTIQSLKNIDFKTPQKGKDVYLGGFVDEQFAKKDNKMLCEHSFVFLKDYYDEVKKKAKNPTRYDETVLDSYKKMIPSNEIFSI